MHLGSVDVDGEESIARPPPSGSNYYEFDSSMHLGSVPLVPPIPSSSDSVSVSEDQLDDDEDALYGSVSQLMHDDVCSEEESQIQITFEPIDDALSPLNS